MLRVAPTHHPCGTTRNFMYYPLCHWRCGLYRLGLGFLMKTMTFLIVEDNAGIRRLLRRTLVDTASAIWECTDGSDALAAYEEHRPDIVLMDIRMPLVDGLTATRQIRDYDPSARII